MPTLTHVSAREVDDLVTAIGRPKGVSVSEVTRTGSGWTVEALRVQYGVSSPASGRAGNALATLVMVVFDLGGYVVCWVCVEAGVAEPNRPSQGSPARGRAGRPVGLPADELVSC